ncbi:MULTISPECIES: hypothetical protein, partial [unclassified Neorhizobium]|uniref:hypothetical protein n=1 Tax=unclassified Neorhizobium TaxID=2629175 RepID=UPI001FF3AB79
YREFLTFIHNLVSTSFKWTPHAKAHSNTEGAEKFALTNMSPALLRKPLSTNSWKRPEQNTSGINFQGSIRTNYHLARKCVSRTPDGYAEIL